MVIAAFLRMVKNQKDSRYLWTDEMDKSTQRGKYCPILDKFLQSHENSVGNIMCTAKRQKL